MLRIREVRKPKGLIPVWVGLVAGLAFIFLTWALAYKTYQVQQALQACETKQADE